jgi:hypothetical protein
LERESGVPSLVARDARHGGADDGIACDLGLPSRHECAEGLTHATFDRILEGHRLQMANGRQIDARVHRGGAMSLREGASHARVANFVASRSLRGTHKASRRTVGHELATQVAERVD